MKYRYREPHEMKDSGVECLGMIPKEWKSVKVKHTFKFFRGLAITKSDLKDEGVQCLNYGEIHSKYPCFIDTKNNNLKKVSKEYLKTNSNSLLKNGDLVFADTSEDLKGSGNFTYIGGNENIFAGYHTVTMRSNKNKPNKYLAYLFDSIDIRKQIQLKVKGVKVYSITQSILKDIFILKSKEEEKIADFLDQKTAEFDAVIEKKEKLIEKLEEAKKSLISEVVTGKKKVYIDESGQLKVENRPTEEMKDSGIGWLGLIPKEWKVKRIKNIYSLRNERNKKEMKEVEILSLYTSLGVKKSKDIENKTGNKVFTVEDYKIVYPYDIVVNIILAWMGSIGVSHYNGVISPAYDIYKPLKCVNSNFYNYLFRTDNFAGECFKYGRGIMLMRWRTYSSEFRTIKVVYPNFIEQTNIADFLDKKITEVDCIIQKNKDQIEKIKEAKQSLISEAVTGEIEVLD